MQYGYVPVVTNTVIQAQQVYSEPRRMLQSMQPMQPMPHMMQSAMQPPPVYSLTGQPIQMMYSNNGINMNGPPPPSAQEQFQGMQPGVPVKPMYKSHQTQKRQSRHPDFLNMNSVIANPSSNANINAQTININQQQNIAPLQNTESVSGEGNSEMNKLSEGDAILAGSYIGVIRYLGPLYTKQSNGKIHKSSKKYIGIECTELPPNTIGHSGWYKDFRYFHTRFGNDNGILVPATHFTRKLVPWFLLDTIKSQYSATFDIKEVLSKTNQEIAVLKMTIEALLNERQMAITRPSSPVLQMQPSEQYIINPPPMKRPHPNRVMRRAYTTQTVCPEDVDPFYNGNAANGVLPGAPPPLGYNYSAPSPVAYQKQKRRRNNRRNNKQMRPVRHARTGFDGLLINKKQKGQYQRRGGMPPKKGRHVAINSSPCTAHSYGSSSSSCSDSESTSAFDDYDFERIQDSQGSSDSNLDDMDDNGVITKSPSAPVLLLRDNVSEDVLSKKMKHHKYVVDLPIPHATASRKGKAQSKSKGAHSASDLRKLAFLNSNSVSPQSASHSTDCKTPLFMTTLKTHLNNYGTPRMSVMTIPENVFDHDPLEQSMIDNGLLAITPLSQSGHHSPDSAQLARHHTVHHFSQESDESDYKLGYVPAMRTVVSGHCQDDDNDDMSIKWSSGSDDDDNAEGSTIWALANFGSDTDDDVKNIDDNDSFCKEGLKKQKTFRIKVSEIE